MIGGDDEQGHEGEPEPVNEDWNADDTAPAPEEVLPLDDSEALPWLESADDDLDDEEGGDISRLLTLALIGLAALIVLIGGLWWLSHRGNDEAALADGSTIAAPATPYKEAPKDPGGKTFDGTGDSSFAVSEGQTRPAKIAAGPSEAPTPTPTASASAQPSPAASPSAAASAAPVAPGVGVQVGAFSSKEAAEAGWSKLAQQYSALSGVSHRVLQGKADIGTVYRLQAVSGNIAGATALCAQLRSAGLACQVKQ